MALQGLPQRNLHQLIHSVYPLAKQTHAVSTTTISLHTFFLVHSRRTICTQFAPSFRVLSHSACVGVVSTHDLLKTLRRQCRILRAPFRSDVTHSASSRTPVFGCFNVSRASTGYESKACKIAETNGQIQRAGGHFMQALLQSSLANSAMSDVSTTAVVFSQTGDRSIFSHNRDAGSVRPDANTLIFGGGGRENALPSIEGQRVQSEKRKSLQEAPG